MCPGNFSRRLHLEWTPKASSRFVGCVSGILSNLFPSKATLSRRNRKNSDGLRFDEYGECSISSTSFLARNCLMIFLYEGEQSHEQKTIHLVVRIGVVPCVDVS
ncbi:hypothetical protein TNCV_4922701 [Trichonephila clavipes]|nr:hypothetical protein TNCV_4922701 [Trichonephila clavipes]